jgi:hypothetical protein
LKAARQDMSVNSKDSMPLHAYSSLENSHARSLLAVWFIRLFGLPEAEKVHKSAKVRRRFADESTSEWGGRERSMCTPVQRPCLVDNIHSNDRVPRKSVGSEFADVDGKRHHEALTAPSRRIDVEAQLEGQGCIHVSGEGGEYQAQSHPSISDEDLQAMSGMLPHFLLYNSWSGCMGFGMEARMNEMSLEPRQATYADQDEDSTRLSIEIKLQRMTIHSR